MVLQGTTRSFIPTDSNIATKKMVKCLFVACLLIGHSVADIEAAASLHVQPHASSRPPPKSWMTPLYHWSPLCFVDIHHVQKTTINPIMQNVGNNHLQDGRFRCNKQKTVALKSKADNYNGEKVYAPSAKEQMQQQVQFIGKSTESFKLADLYWLESCVMAHCLNQQMQKSALTAETEADLVERIAFHRPTASYLLSYHALPVDENGNRIYNSEISYQIIRTKTGIAKNIDLPFRPCRFQYVAQVVASGQTPQELVENIHQEIAIIKSMHHSFWTLEYDIFEPLKNPLHQRIFTSNMLMCAISRVLPGEPSLTSAGAGKDSDEIAYIIVETSTKLYLVQKMTCSVKENFSISNLPILHINPTLSISKHFRTAWSNRPFQYSGAINLDVAFTVVDVLRDLVKANALNHINSKASAALSSIKDDASSYGAIRMLDPTCGSGTFLALALMAWGDERMNKKIEFVGVDSNPKCFSGTVKNLRKLFLQGAIENSLLECEESESWTLKTDSSAKVTVYAGDSVTIVPKFTETEKFDCAVANLPWNRNTFEFRGDAEADTSSQEIGTNRGILESTASALRPGAPLVVVSGERQSDNEQRIRFDAKTCLKNMGFQIIGEITVPPAGFSLPKSEKKKKGNTEKDQSEQNKSRSSDCVIIVAISPVASRK